MSFLVPEDVSIRFLEGEPIPPFGPVGPNVTREQALAFLKEQSGVDFGDDTVAWRKWFRENQPHVVAWFIMSLDERYIGILEDRDSMQILGFGDKPHARQHLIKLTGQDFGDDSEAWRQWYRTHRSDLAKRFVYG